MNDVRKMKDIMAPEAIDHIRRVFGSDQDKERALQEEHDRADQLDAMRYAFEQIEQQEEAKRRAVIIGTGRRNGHTLAVDLTAAASAAGIDPTSKDFADLISRVSEKVKEVAVAIHDMVDIVMAAINEIWQTMKDSWEEIQKLIEEYENADEPEEEDRHDGAVKVLVTWLLPVPTLYELYGQGVDHGGPDPSRLTLIRVTDDGLRRAETGTKQERRQRNATEKGLQAGRGVRPGHRDRMGEGHETRRPHEPGTDRTDHAAAGRSGHRSDLCPRRGGEHGRSAVLRRRSDPGAAPACDHGSREAGPPSRRHRREEEPGKEGAKMKQKPAQGFRCYICGEVFPDQTERATPCGYERFGQVTCKNCCERCHDLPPIPCPEYNRRKRREEKEARKV